MKPIAQSFSVSYQYKLYFTQGLFNLKNNQFSAVFDVLTETTNSKLLFVIDDGVAKHHANLINDIIAYCKAHNSKLKYTSSLIVKGGEQCKNDYEQVNLVLKAINEFHIDRHSFVVAIGGGAVIDMVGYAAAVAHRGVKLVRIPTTVLSQNDSAVGVKNSINTFGKKNFLGTFAPPFAIINDSNFLKTLEQRDWISGVAEAIKVALIKDEVFFKYLEEHASSIQKRDMKAMNYMIYRCAEMHMQHIAQGGDPFESGSSRPLDFGHWAAHKMEQITNYELRHGEAVAKGIALDVTYAYLLELITESELKRILNLMQQIGFDLSIPVETESEIEVLLKGLQEFQEHLGGELCITLINGIGVKHDVNQIDKVKMRLAIDELYKRCKLNS